jgi:ornithine cyclodeaminase/alanine dehydrogenase-like protein (mu-crystallin family)
MPRSWAGRIGWSSIRRSQCERLGELRAALAAGTLPADRSVDELGEIVAGLKPGRRSADEITVCDLTGTGAQDTAIAVHAVRAAASRGAEPSRMTSP